MKPKLTGYARLLLSKSRERAGEIQLGRPSTGKVPSKRAAKNQAKTGWSKGLPCFGASFDDNR